MPMMLDQAELILLSIFGLVILLYYIMLCITRPVAALAVAVAVTILVPVEIATRLGSLPRIGPTRAVVGVFLILYLARELLAKNSIGRSTGSSGITFFIVLFFLSMLSSFFMSVDPATSFYFLMDEFVIFCLFLVFMRVIPNDDNWLVLKRTLYAVTAVVCLFAIFEFLTHINPLISLMFTPDDEGSRVVKLGLWRVRGTFYHPIAFGVFLNLIFPFVLVDVIEHKGPVRVMLLILFTFIIVAQFFTVSRGPWLVMIFSFGMIYWLNL